ncbi:MAG: heavy metal-responsive transcriptional regulator [Nitrospinae bacterium]|nr:heavy metal-responsive transcriptional regulator [Nitrospinota bacterium]
MANLKRGELARQCGVNGETLRYYEKRKLLAPPVRSSSGYRLYSQDDVARIRFIKNAQKVGFTLSDIEGLLKLRVEKNRPCESVLAKAQTKLMEVDKKLAGLKAMRKVLTRLIDQCERAAPTSQCPILESFEYAIENPMKKERRLT